MSAIFTHRLAGLLDTHHMTYAELARRLSIAKTTTNEWREKVPRAEYLLAIAELFGVSVDWLMGRSNAPKWSPEVQSRCDQLRVLLSSQEQSDLATPAQRLADALTLWRSLDDQERSDWQMAVRLGVSQPELAQLRKGTAAVDDSVMAQFSQFTGIPVQWILTGESLQIAPTGLQEYIPAIMSLRATGVTGAELQDNLSVVIHMIEHVRPTPPGARSRTK